MVGNWHQRADIPSGFDRRWVYKVMANPFLRDYPYTRLLERKTAIRVFSHLWRMTSVSYCRVHPTALLSKGEVCQLKEMVLCFAEGFWKDWSGRKLYRTRFHVSQRGGHARIVFDG